MELRHRSSRIHGSADAMDLVNRGLLLPPTVSLTNTKATIVKVAVGRRCHWSLLHASCRCCEAMPSASVAAAWEVAGSPGDALFAAQSLKMP
ncbi:hypothetical protein VPH35_089721 [Triticum aestivum]